MKCHWYVLSRAVTVAVEADIVEDRQADQEVLTITWTKGDNGWNQSSSNGDGKNWTDSRHIYK